MKGKNIDKVPSGIRGFDEISDGGFIRNSIISLVGDVGSGKTIFGTEFIYRGITEYEENGMYIGFEEPKKNVYRYLLKFGWNMKALEDSQKLIFLEYPPHEVDIFFEQEDTLLNLIDKFAVSRLVIDPLGVVGMHFPDEASKKEGLLKLADRLRKWGCTTILISGTHDVKADISASISALADTAIQLYTPLIEGRRMRGIEIVEMRGSAHSQIVHEMLIDSKGIKIDPHSVLQITKG